MRSHDRAREKEREREAGELEKHPGAAYLELWGKKKKKNRGVREREARASIEEKRTRPRNVRVELPLFFFFKTLSVSWRLRALRGSGTRSSRFLSGACLIFLCSLPSRGRKTEASAAWGKSFYFFQCRISNNPFQMFHRLHQLCRHLCRTPSSSSSTGSACLTAVTFSTRSSSKCSPEEEEQAELR